MRVVVNAAASADGKLSTRRREQLEISGPEDFVRVARLRADSDAIMVGVGTILADDPSLTLDDPELQVGCSPESHPDQPARIVADSRARTPPDARVVDDVARTYVLVADAAPDDRVETLEGSTTEIIRAGEDRVDLGAALSALESRGVEALMVEGGGELLFSLFEAGLVDELSVYVDGRIVGGREAPTLADGEGFVDAFPELALEEVRRLDDGVLLRWMVEDGRPD